MVSSSSTVFVLFSGSVPFSPRSVEETNVCRTELHTVCELLPHREDLVDDDDDDDDDYGVSSSPTRKTWSAIRRCWGCRLILDETFPLGI